MRRVGLLFCLLVPLPAQQGPVNLDFKDTGPQGKPTGWAWVNQPGYSIATLEDCRGPNSRYAMVCSQDGSVPRGLGNFLPSFDATALRGKQVRYRAWLRLEAPTLSGTTENTQKNLTSPVCWNREEGRCRATAQKNSQIWGFQNKSQIRDRGTSIPRDRVPENTKK